MSDWLRVPIAFRPDLLATVYDIEREAEVDTSTKTSDALAVSLIRALDATCPW